jgi:hypothetical protein
MSESGYCDCQCRDCFDIAIADDCRSARNSDGTPAMCLECREAGCEGDAECSRNDVGEQ